MAILVTKVCDLCLKEPPTTTTMIHFYFKVAPPDKVEKVLGEIEAKILQVAEDATHH